MPGLRGTTLPEDQGRPELTPRPAHPRSSTLPDNNINLLDMSAGFEPKQIHLTYWGSPSRMAVSFATLSGTVTMGEPPAAPQATTTAYVQWGAKADALSANATCFTMTYVQNQFAILKSPSYVSPYLSHCLMSGGSRGGRAGLGFHQGGRAAV